MTTTPRAIPKTNDTSRASGLVFPVFKTTPGRYSAGRMVEWPWAKLAEYLGKPTVCPNDGTPDSIAKAKRSRGGFVGGIITGGHRCSDNLEAMTVVHVDYDHDVPADFFERVERIGADFIAHTSYSATKANPKFHLFVPLDRPVDLDEYATIHAHLCGELGADVRADPTSSHISQQVFASVIPTPDAYFEHRWAADRGPLDTAAVLAVAKPCTVQRTAPGDTAAGLAFLDGLTDEPPCPDVAGFMETFDEHFAASEDRHGDLLKRANRLVAMGFEGHRGIATALDALSAAFTAATGRAAEAARTIEDAAAKQAGSHPDGPVTAHAGDACFALDFPPFSADELAELGRVEEAILAEVEETKAAAELTGDDVPADLEESIRARRELEAAEEEARRLREAESRFAASSWAPTSILDTFRGVKSGEIERESPTIGLVEGGRCLFYAGRINGVAGDSSAGKSWTAILTALQEMRKGHHVLFIDYEDTRQGIAERLLSLGATEDDLAFLCYVEQPETRFGPAETAGLSAWMERTRPTLAVIDSVGESLAMEGKNPNADEEVALWFKALPKVLVKSGAAVVILDHLPKDQKATHVFAIGSQRKRAAITGAQYVQTVKSPFSRSKAGGSSLVVTKDRLGNAASGELVAELRIDPDAEVLARFAAGPSLGESGRPSRVEEMKARVAAYVEREPGRTKNGITKGIGGKADDVAAAISALEAEGFVRVDRTSRGHFVYSAKPFDFDADDFTDEELTD